MHPSNPTSTGHKAVCERGSHDPCLRGSHKLVETEFLDWPNLGHWSTSLPGEGGTTGLIVLPRLCLEQFPKGMCWDAVVRRRVEWLWEGKPTDVHWIRGIYSSRGWARTCDCSISLSPFLERTYSFVYPWPNCRIWTQGPVIRTRENPSPGYLAVSVLIWVLPSPPPPKFISYC